MRSSKANQNIIFGKKIIIINGSIKSSTKAIIRPAVGEIKGPAHYNNLRTLYFTNQILNRNSSLIIF